MLTNLRISFRCCSSQQRADNIGSLNFLQLNFHHFDFVVPLSFKAIHHMDEVDVRKFSFVNVAAGFLHSIPVGLNSSKMMKLTHTPKKWKSASTFPFYK